MSDTDRDVARKGRETVRKARTRVLEARMDAFVREHHPSTDLKILRRSVSGEPMADIVRDGRNERV